MEINKEKKPPPDNNNGTPCLVIDVAKKNDEIKPNRVA